jgi:betaine reductase
MIELRGKLILALGERDGIPAQAIAACADSAGGRVVYASTQCFV